MRIAEKSIALARTVDHGDQSRQRRLLGTRDLFQIRPEGIFKTNAVLCPSITIERLTIEDFIGAPKTPLPIILVKQIWSWALVHYRSRAVRRLVMPVERHPL